MEIPWYERAYRRVCVDMHITEDDPRFLSAFDPARYVEMLQLAQVRSAVVYAHSHVGHCNFPTQVGHQHAGLGGRDILGEVIARCQQAEIAVVVYYSLIYDTWAYRTHPDWRIIGANGQPVAEHSRYGVCCPNSPYRDYAAAIVEELCRGYEFAGLRFDMTFWPHVCYCPACQARFAQEVGGALPRIVDWRDPQWVAFQRRREAWLVDFAAHLTTTVRRLRPAVTVEHQASTYASTWRMGVTHALAAQTDFLQGDFYGDALQGSFARKLFHNLTPHRPAGFETSIGVDLSNYTALKSDELMRCKASAALADGSAFVFIDSIDPLGTLNRAVFARMGRVFAHTAPYERHLGGELAQDVGIYLSTVSKGDFADNGKAVDDPTLSRRMPHVEAALGVAKALLDAHIPFGVLTKGSLGQLARHDILILPNVLAMDEEEAQAFREYVWQGGSLYASQTTSLLRTDGLPQADFALADVLGVSYRGETKESFTYIAPTAGAEPLFADYTATHPAGMRATQFLVEAHPTAQVWGRVVLPHTDPADTQHYASIHNNPPGRATDHPAIVDHPYGQGQALYVSGEIEATAPLRDLLTNLIRRLARRPFSWQAVAPKAVEITLFRQPERQRWLVSLVNFQPELPNIPVEGIVVRLRLDGQTPRRLLALPEEREVPYTIVEGAVQFVAARLETLAMYALELA
jgi:hypothetical protein